MKTNLLRSFLLAFFVMCFVSCEKEVEVLPKTGVLEEQTIETIKAFLNENSVLYVGVKRNNFENLMLSLDWERASYAIEPNGMSIVKVNSVMEVPINRIGKKSTRQLVISMNKQEVKDAYVLDIIAAEAFQRFATNNVRSNTDNNRVLKVGFSGEKISYDLGLRMQERLYYRNGELTQRDVLKEESNGGVGIQGGDSQVQQCIAWYLYTTYYYSDGSSSTTREYLYTTCEGGYECMPYVVGDDGSAIGVNCGGGGGGGGGYDEPTPAPVRDIIDDFKTLCFKNVLIDLKNRGLTNKVSDALLKIFNSGDKINLTFAEDSNLGYGKYADTFITRDTRNIGGAMDIEITLNTSFMANASKEVVAETMIHEILHAYIDATSNMRDQVEHHIEMGEKYIDWSFGAMKELFPSMPDNEIYAIVLSGFGQLQSVKPDYVNELITRYKLSSGDISKISEQYRVSEKGTVCK